MSSENEVLERIALAPPALRPGWRWSPIVGEETRELLRNIDALKDDSAARDLVQNEAIDILARCPPPNGAEPCSETGLAIGYVQSGKTMSFTTLAALARDNNFQLVIVVTGTSTLLTDQSCNRLRKDFRIEQRLDRPWCYQHAKDAKDWRQRAPELKDSFELWFAPRSQPSDKRTVLLTVMKHHRHLAEVSNALASIPQTTRDRLNVLIIDDEADQAGLNAKVQKEEESTTYRKLLNLKALFRHHAYIQYTATPQALVLLNLIDVLSPNFAVLLSPGSGYVGGKDFFTTTPKLYRVIPESEISPTPTSAPAGLQDALRIFLLGVAESDLAGTRAGNRSMLVHPSLKRDGHKQYHDWVRELKKQWSDVLALNDSEPDRIQLVAKFSESYEDLQRTAGRLLPFTELCNRLPLVLKRTTIQLVNASSGTTPTIDWEKSDSCILVGGQALDRGFTVKGLTVTYMPRGLGEGNADTVQQRARFFGYKQSMRGLCRVYLDDEALEAFRDYVAHEESLRANIAKCNRENIALNDWARTFLLSPALRPTRKNVIDIPYVQEAIDEKSYIWMRSPHSSPPAIAENRAVIRNFVEGIAENLWSESDGHPSRTSTQTPLVARLKLSDVYEQLLVKLQFRDWSDSKRMNSVRALVQWYLGTTQASDAIATVFQMRSDPSTDLRTRKLAGDDPGVIENLFQGRSPATTGGLGEGEVYPGDREIWEPSSSLNIQIHRLNLRRTGPIIHSDVFTIAMRVSSALAGGVVFQPQGKA